MFCGLVTSEVCAESYEAEVWVMYTRRSHASAEILHMYFCYFVDREEEKSLISFLSFLIRGMLILNEGRYMKITTHRNSFSCELVQCKHHLIIFMLCH